jgi:type IV secretion system protein TrbL
MNNPSLILNQYQSLMSLWYQGIQPMALKLYWSLVIIEFAFWAIERILSGEELASWMGAFVKKILAIGFWYAMILNASTWMTAIVESLSRIGLLAGGFKAPMSPSDVWANFMFLTEILLTRASNAGWLGPFSATGMGLMFAAMMVAASGAALCLLLLMANITAYITLAIGGLLLAFSGSRWTQPFAERYISLAVSSGIRLMVVQAMISFAGVLVLAWNAAAANLNNAASGVMTSWDIAFSSLIFTSLCWSVPRIVSTILSGTPNFSGHEVLGTAATVAGVAASAARMAVAASQVSLAAGQAAGLVGTSTVEQASQMGANGNGAKSKSRP